MRLRRREDVRTLGFVAAWFAVVGVGFTGAAPLWLVAPASAWLAFTGAVIAHNTVHVPVFAGRAANDVFQVVLSAHPYRHSRNFTGGLANWLFFNNGYHTMHHRRPQLHWADLPRAHAAEIAPHLPASLAQPSLLAWVFRTYCLPGGRRTWDDRPVELAALEAS